MIQTYFLISYSTVASFNVLKEINPLMLCMLFYFIMQDIRFFSIVRSCTNMPFLRRVHCILLLLLGLYSLLLFRVLFHN